MSDEHLAVEQAEDYFQIEQGRGTGGQAAIVDPDGMVWWFDHNNDDGTIEDVCEQMNKALDLGTKSRPLVTRPLAEREAYAEGFKNGFNDARAQDA